MARLLTPGVVGEFAIALLILTLLEVITHTGFEAALVQKKGDIEDDLDSVWTAQLIRAALLAFVVFITAPLVAAFFRTPAVEVPLRVLAVSPILRGLSSARTLRFQRDMDFKSRFAYVFGGDVVSFIVVVSAAASLRNVWALVFGLLARDLSMVILSYVLRPNLPRLRLDLVRLQRLFLFSRWITVNRIVTYLANEGDDILLGRVLGAATLGLYQIAYRISHLVSTEITQVLDRATFPAYARVQGEAERLRRAYLFGLEAASSLVFPVTAGILLLAPEFVAVVLGPQWLPTVPLMRVLAVAGLIRAIALTSAPLIRAIGRPQLLFRMILIRLIVMGVVIYPLTLSRGMVGTAVAVLIGAGAMIPGWWTATSEALQGQQSARLVSMAPSFVGTALMASVVLLALSLVGDDPAARLIAGSLIGALFYAFFHGVLWLVWGIGGGRVALALYRGLRTGNPGLAPGPAVS